MNRITEEQFEDLVGKAITIMEEYRKFLPNDTCVGIDYYRKYDSDGNPEHMAYIKVIPKEECKHFYLFMIDTLEKTKGIVESFRSYLDELTRNRRKVVEAPEAIYGTGHEGFTHDEIVKPQQRTAGNR